jgi:hypothetical protein
MSYQLSYDEKGNPVHVTEDKGFLITSGPYREEEHGWMKDQLNYSEFPMIRHGQDMEYLVSLVNMLKKENFFLKQEKERWRKASGF